ncbi:hypothetical protein BJY52DRAFT_1228110 [Lactarius psammicola]|nr:hypothetical protein BJY52DRAFT_1228110 [Lactarius psammicola]
MKEQKGETHQSQDLTKAGFKKLKILRLDATAEELTEFCQCDDGLLIIADKSWSKRVSALSDKAVAFMKIFDSTYGLTPRRPIRTSTSTVLLERLTMMLAVSTSLVGDDVTILYSIAKLSEMYTSRKQPAKPSLRFLAWEKHVGASQRTLEATDPLSSDYYSNTIQTASPIGLDQILRHWITDIETHIDEMTVPMNNAPRIEVKRNNKNGQQWNGRKGGQWKRSITPLAAVLIKVCHGACTDRKAMTDDQSE